MGLFEVCANIDPTHTVLIVRDSSGEVVHRIEKPPRWGSAVGRIHRFRRIGVGIAHVGIPPGPGRGLGHRPLVSPHPRRSRTGQPFSR